MAHTTRRSITSRTTASARDRTQRPRGRCIDVRLTPSSQDGGAWTARVLTRRARQLFQADEIALAGAARQWVLLLAAHGDLIVD